VTAPGRRVGPVPRRRVLALAGIGATAAACGVLGGCAAGPVTGPPGEDLREPPVIESRDGRLSVTLTAAPGTRIAGRDTAALGYNGSSPGPTIRVRPGDLLSIRLVNGLDRPTNLHTHGLLVSPGGNGDNPFVRVEPGAAFDYLHRVPADHPAGTHWYHPHHHGTVADQVFGGLVGALLVDGGPELAVAADRVLMVTDITLDERGQVAPAGPMDRMTGRLGRLVLVNGQYRPVIRATPGAPQRWRIVNGCVSRVLRLRLAGHPLVQVAQDGCFLPAPTARDQLVLAPGNRADVIVTAGSAGSYDLAADGGGRADGPMGSAAGGPVTLATLVTAGTPATPLPLPATLPSPPGPSGPVQRRRRITFGSAGMGMGMVPTIDGRAFDPQRDDQVVALGSTEEWTITNPSAQAHPFHLHAWPFTVLECSDGSASPDAVHDVVLVPAGGWARLLIGFTARPGRSVFHCHILDHEDAGMMATVVVTA
jgi:FtsP/CotA-like multicopper oxidase with cupredoxin domain